MGKGKGLVDRFLLGEKVVAELVNGLREKANGTNIDAAIGFMILAGLIDSSDTMDQVEAIRQTIAKIDIDSVTAKKPGILQ